MPEPGLIREKVISYLSGLSPNARAMLVRKLERADDGNALDMQAQIILDAARMLERKQQPGTSMPPAAATSSVTLKGDFRSRFFAPYAPFIIEESLAQHQAGWVSLASIDAIWTYLTREVMPDELGPMLQPIDKLGFKSEKDVETAAAELRDQAFAKLARIDRDSENESKARQRFISRLGGQSGLADWHEMQSLCDRLPRLERLFTKLPKEVSHTEASEKLVIDQLAIHFASNPGDAAAVAAGLVSRLSSASALVRFAIAMMGTTEVAAIRKSPMAPMIDVALSAAERAGLRFARQRNDPNGVQNQVNELRYFHEVIRGTTMVLDLGEDPVWRGRLASVRKDISETLTQDIEDVLACLRRGLRFDENNRPGEADIDDAYRAVVLLATARRCRDTLAVNELLNRLATTTEQAVEMYGRDLIDKLRVATPWDRDLLIKVTERVVAMSEQLFGEEYAGHLRRAREKAISKQ